MEKSAVGDWFLLYLLGQNIDHIVFRDVFHDLAKKLGYRSKDMSDPWKGFAAHALYKIEDDLPATRPRGAGAGSPRVLFRYNSTATNIFSRSLLYIID